MNEDIFVKSALEIVQRSSSRMDANETAFLERELVRLRAKEFDTLYGASVARRLVPKATDIGAAESYYAYKVYSRSGRAAIGSYEADDLPDISTAAKEVQGKIYPVTASYTYNIEELRFSAARRIALSDKMQSNARSAIETGVDDMLFQGYPTPNEGGASVSCKGLVNNADVAAAGIESLTKWTDATAVATIQADMNKVVARIRRDSMQQLVADTIAMPLTYYELISQKSVGVDNQKTILQAFLESNPYITSIEPWYKLDNQGANATGRMIAYKKDPMVLEGIINQEFEQLAPQERNFKLVVPCHAKCGGVAIYQPVGVCYGDYAA